MFVVESVLSCTAVIRERTSQLPQQCEERLTCGHLTSL